MTGAPVNTEAPQPEEWFFSFGHGQYHPETGQHLLDHYVRIPGSFAEARQEMIRIFGTMWCDQYGSAEAAGVGRWKLKEIELPSEPWPAREAR